MQSQANSPEAYENELPDDRKMVIQKLRDLLKENLPVGFEETMQYGMLGYVVPYTLYPQGYHCLPKQPLPFISLASQKQFIALYHMGLYAMPELLEWFKAEYPKHISTKLDMGKSCIRFKKMDQIPYGLLKELIQKITVDQWIALYESSREKK